LVTEKTTIIKYTSSNFSENEVRAIRNELYARLQQNNQNTESIGDNKDAYEWAVQVDGGDDVAALLANQANLKLIRKVILNK
jgi:hypothetical protein